MRFKPAYGVEAPLGLLDCLILSDGKWDRISVHIIADERTRGLWIVTIGCLSNTRTH